MITFDFHDKIVLVTGASRGIGKATAGLFAKSGAHVIVHFLKHEDAAQKALNGFPGKNHSKFRADISRPDEVRKLADFCFEKYGRLDVLVNNAGVFEEFNIMEMSYGDWQAAWNHTISTNLTGAANLSFLVAREMKSKGGCRIINVSSRGAFRGEPDAPAYGASKAGLNALGQSMAKALARYNVYVFTVAPGYVDTDMATHAMVGEKANEIRNQSPMQRIARPQEVAQAICYLASEGTDYHTGCIVDINGASYLRT
jgi:3-oxoacyl-[acyl-carrier protein] reductase